MDFRTEILMPMQIFVIVKCALTAPVCALRGISLHNRLLRQGQARTPVGAAYRPITAQRPQHCQRVIAYTLFTRPV